MSQVFTFGNEEELEDSATTQKKKEGTKGGKKGGKKGAPLLEKGGVALIVNKLMNRAPASTSSIFLNSS
jgi:hypothetical protein